MEIEEKHARACSYREMPPAGYSARSGILTTGCEGPEIVSMIFSSATEAASMFMSGLELYWCLGYVMETGWDFVDECRRIKMLVVGFRSWVSDHYC